MTDGLVLAPFRAAYLDPGQVDLGAVVCPPYDVVEPAEDAQLRARSPYNVVHLVRPRADDSPDGVTGGGADRDGDPDDAYEHAAALIRRWRSDRVLCREPVEALYVYEQVVAGHRLRGLVGAVGVRDDAERIVLPHEEVFAGPVADRLALMQATDAQFEPILLVHVGASHLDELIARVSAGPPWLSAAAPDGSEHRVWRVSNPADLAAIAATLVGTRALIADGHHRYATYQRLQHERRAAGRGAGPWDFGLALLVATEPGGLELGAIHRTVRGATMADALGATALGVAVESVPALDASAGSERTATHLARLASGPGGPDRPANDATTTVVVTDGSSAAKLRIRPRADDRRSRLASTVVSEWLLPRAFGCADDSARVEFHHEAAHAVAAVATDGGGRGLAVLLPPPALADVTGLADAGQRMPRKSTSFGPKPRSGLVLRFLS